MSNPERDSSAREWPVAIVGAGAAGMLAAIFAGRGGVPVVLLETRPTPGAKIRVSGGGRCNVLPSRLELADFHTSGSENTLRNILFSWDLGLVRAFFESDLGVELKVEPTGKVFPKSDDAKEVVSALVRASERAGAVLKAPWRVAAARTVERRSETWFELESESGETLWCRKLVLATGGLSLPKTGSDGGGMRIAESLGHRIAPTYPALVPLFGSLQRWSELAGLSLPVRLTAVRGETVLEEREGDFLFTHRGFSGPVALDVSYRFSAPGFEGAALYARWGGSAAPSWEEALRRGGRTTAGGFVRLHLPRRLAAILFELAGVDQETKLSELSRDARQRLASVLERCELGIAGNEGYRTAEVTGGGIFLSDVVVKTLESRIVPGLYFCGEILDGTGRLGGFNFLWAWVTGRKVGLALAAR